MSAPHRAPDALEPAIEPVPTRIERRLATLDRLPKKAMGIALQAMFAHVRRFGGGKRMVKGPVFLWAQNGSYVKTRG